MESEEPRPPTPPAPDAAPDQQTNPAPTSPTSTLLHTASALSLEPLRRYGADALDPHGVPSLESITLSELEVTQKNEPHDVTIIKAGDILRPAAATTSRRPIIPKRGILTRAILALHLFGTPHPRTAEIRLPDTIKVERASDAPLIQAWLAKSSFHLPITIIPLAVLLAIAPAFNDGDGDDDDLESDRFHSRVTRLCRRLAPPPSSLPARPHCRPHSPCQSQPSMGLDRRSPHLNVAKPGPRPFPIRVHPCSSVVKFPISAFPRFSVSAFPPHECPGFMFS